MAQNKGFEMVSMYTVKYVISDLLSNNLQDSHNLLKEKVVNTYYIGISVCVYFEYFSVCWFTVNNDILLHPT